MGHCEACSCGRAASSGVVGRKVCQTGLLKAWPNTCSSARPGHEHTNLTESCGSVGP